MSILVLTSDTLIGTPATGNLEYNGQFFGTDSNASRAQMQRITQGTAVASTSGTAIDYTGIPAWVKKITVMFGGVSTNSTSNLLVQLGYQSPVTSTGYVSTCAYNGAGTLQSVNSTAGFVIVTQNASQTVYGQLIISLIGSNIWVASGNFTNSTTASSMVSGGVTLSGTLDRVRITSVTPDTFDAGSVNLLWEG